MEDAPLERILKLWLRLLRHPGPRSPSTPRLLSLSRRRRRPFPTKTPSDLNGGCASRTHSQVVASPPAPSRAPQPVNASVAVSEPPATAALPDENAFRSEWRMRLSNAFSSCGFASCAIPGPAARQRLGCCL